MLKKYCQIPQVLPKRHQGKNLFTFLAPSSNASLNVFLGLHWTLPWMFFCFLFLLSQFLHWASAWLIHCDNRKQKMKQSECGALRGWQKGEEQSSAARDDYRWRHIICNLHCRGRSSSARMTLMSVTPRAHCRRSQDSPAVHSTETEAKRQPPEDSHVCAVNAEANRHCWEGTCEMKICVQLRSNLDAFWMQFGCIPFCCCQIWS